MQIIYTAIPKGKRRSNSRLRKLNEEHETYLKSFMTNRSLSPVTKKQEAKSISRIPLSNTIPGPAYKQSVDDYKWKKDRQETAETILEIERKKTRIAPGWNKGGYTYISDATDPTTLGRKL